VDAMSELSGSSISGIALHLDHRAHKQATLASPHRRAKITFRLRPLTGAF